MPEKKCTKCGESKSTFLFSRRTDRPSGFVSQCNDCRREAARVKRSVAKLDLKIKRGLWPEATVCVICGSTENVQWHHDDYDYPEEVIELCQATCYPMAVRLKRKRDSQAKTA